MKLSPQTRLPKLLAAYPFLLDYLAGYHPHFEILKNKAMRLTIGRVATLRKIADIGHLPVDQLLTDLAAQIRAHTGETAEVDRGAAPPPDKIAALKDIITELHQGATPQQVRARFDELVGDAAPTEIAAMEEMLIREGMPVSEIQRLCDVHVGVFKDALADNDEIDVPPGHPVHTFLAENAQITCLVDELNAHVNALDASSDLTDLAAFLADLAQIDKHYLRKEYQLFPFLEKHGASGPPKVMWALHDELRALLKAMRAAAAAGDRAVLREVAPKFARDVAEMVFKENKILFPLALSTLSEEEWQTMRRGEGEIGYAFVQPAGDWPGASATVTASAAGGQLDLRTGLLSLEQLNLMLTTLPVDISLVDENDEVRFYSDGKDRLFPRSPAVIGRKVQNCHPPKSVATVQRILDAFRAGQKDLAEFWLELGGKFIHIRYFALRDAAGRYRGTLEMMQDVTAIRALTGQQRLLDWND